MGETFDISDIVFRGIEKPPKDGLLWAAYLPHLGGWAVFADGDIAQQEVTGYPVGELQDHEADPQLREHAEDGKLIIIDVSGGDGNG